MKGRTQNYRIATDVCLVSRVMALYFQIQWRLLDKNLIPTGEHSIIAFMESLGRTQNCLTVMRECREILITAMHYLTMNYLTATDVPPATDIIDTLYQTQS